MNDQEELQLLIKKIQLQTEKLQTQSEKLKQLKIKTIKQNNKKLLFQFNLPYEIENIIIEYLIDESKIETNKSLKEKVEQYYNTENEYLISELDVSCVTSTYWLFENCKYVNVSLNKWDTSNVTNMEGMFGECIHFNQPVNFDTSLCSA